MLEPQEQVYLGKGFPSFALLKQQQILLTLNLPFFFFLNEIIPEIVLACAYKIIWAFCLIRD